MPELRRDEEVELFRAIDVEEANGIMQRHDWGNWILIYYSIMYSTQDPT